MMEIHQRIKNRRIELGMSVIDLSKILGVDRTTIYRYESACIKKLPTNVLVPLSEALQTTPSDLMGWDTPDSTLFTEVLTQTEKQLVNKYRQLSDMGRIRVDDYINLVFDSELNGD